MRRYCVFFVVFSFFFTTGPTQQLEVKKNARGTGKWDVFTSFFFTERPTPPPPPKKKEITRKGRNGGPKWNRRRPLKRLAGVATSDTVSSFHLEVASLVSCLPCRPPPLFPSLFFFCVRPSPFDFNDWFYLGRNEGSATKGKLGNYSVKVTRLPSKSRPLYLFGLEMKRICETKGKTRLNSVIQLWNRKTRVVLAKLGKTR